MCKVGGVFKYQVVIMDVFLESVHHEAQRVVAFVAGFRKKKYTKPPHTESLADNIFWIHILSSQAGREEHLQSFGFMLMAT